MSKRLAISTLAFLVAAVPITSGFSAGQAHKNLLLDGSVLRGVDGKLTAHDSNEGSQKNAEKWFFEFDSDVSDGRGRVKSGTSLELLPSAALEKMTADAKKRSGADYRLWTRVTKYRGRNFLFPTDFLPLGKEVKAQSVISQKSQQQENKPAEIPPAEGVKREPAINEPNDVLAIPQEVIEKLTTRKIGRKTAPTKRLGKGLGLRQDSILADRIGYIHDLGEDVNVVLDALGRKAGQVSFHLLPCEALERAEQQQSTELDPMRFKIAGIVTKYKGNHYLLLQKATQVYNHGNFGR